VRRPAAPSESRCIFRGIGWKVFMVALFVTGGVGVV
jgi:hypothetical protein